MIPQNVTVQKQDEVDDSKEVKSTPTPFIESDVNAVDIDISQKEASNIEDKKIGEKMNSKGASVVENKPVEMEVESNDTSNDPDETEDFHLVLEDTVVEKPNVKTTPPKTEKPPTIMSARTPRRVQLITISSPKRTKAD